MMEMKLDIPNGFIVEIFVCFKCVKVVSRIHFWTSKIQDITQEICDIKNAQNLAAYQK